MKSVIRGKNILEVEITNVSTHGIWLFTNNEELFMSYEDFPWFKEKPLKFVLNVEKLSENHFYWPDLDVDLTKEIIENPSRFPLKYQ